MQDWSKHPVSSGLYLIGGKINIGPHSVWQKPTSSLITLTLKEPPAFSIEASAGDIQLGQQQHCTDSLAVVIWLSKVFRRGDSQQRLAAERDRLGSTRRDWQSRVGTTGGDLQPMMDCYGVEPAAFLWFNYWVNISHLPCFYFASGERGHKSNLG